MRRLKRLAALAQLAVDLRRDRLVPELELAARVLEDDAQLGDEHAPELLHELRLRQAQRQRQAEVLDVVALDQLQLAGEAVEVERLADRRG